MPRGEINWARRRGARCGSGAQGGSPREIGGQRRQALEKAVAEGTPLERRNQTIRLRDRHWNPAAIASFRRRRPDPYERNAAMSWHFERDPIPYALETDWPVGAGGFEPLHL